MNLIAELLVAALASLQDSPTVTLDQSAPVETHLAEIQRATGGKIKVHLDEPGKAVTVKVKDASFFQALDAVCRAHGGVTYFGRTFAGPDGAVDLRPEPWVEYPVQYSGPFRLTVSEMVRVDQQSSVGSRAWTRVMLLVFGPPWIGVSEESGAKADFQVLEAKDAEGRDVLPPANDADPEERVRVAAYPDMANYESSNSARKALRLRAFDIDRGLSILKGKVVLKVAEAGDVSLAPKAGESVAGDSGTLKIDTVSEHSKSIDGTTWRIQLTFSPKDPKRKLRSLVEDGVGDGNGTWRELRLPKQGLTFEAVIGPLPQLPTALIFRVRKGERSVEAPFEFRNLTLKKG